MASPPAAASRPPTLRGPAPSRTPSAPAGGGRLGGSEPPGGGPAAGVAGSAPLARLGAFLGGGTGGYRGSRYRLPFSAAGGEVVRRSARLRPAARRGLDALQPAADEDEPLEFAYHY